MLPGCDQKYWAFSLQHPPWPESPRFQVRVFTLTRTQICTGNLDAALSFIRRTHHIYPRRLHWIPFWEDRKVNFRDAGDDDYDHFEAVVHECLGRRDFDLGRQVV